ncbi:hypothetical protein [Acetobacterium sp.]|uniref:hypothetical protein n=1 Tax=Acetobacterium sp. TaxID=1872094 RepID=UPI00271B6EB5|nr:hypothetical protein [Acetobacterium sp.]MDO9491989.1 hypothetical protein [Acetobacterium sp.]
MSLLENIRNIVTFSIPIIAFIFQLIEFFKRQNSSDYSSLTNYNGPIIYTQINNFVQTEPFKRNTLTKIIDYATSFIFLISVILLYISNFEAPVVDGTFNLSVFLMSFYSTVRDLGVIFSMVAIFLSSILLILSVIFRNASNPTSNFGTIFYYISMTFSLVVALQYWSIYPFEVFLTRTPDTSLLVSFCSLLIIFYFIFLFILCNRLIKLLIPSRYNVLKYIDPIYALLENGVYLITPILVFIVLVYFQN